jgi:hypothetical protein
MANTPLARRLRDEAGSPCPHTVIKHAFGRQSHPHADFTPAAGWVDSEGHLETARSGFLCMTCIAWAAEPAGAMTSRIW